MSRSAIRSVHAVWGSPKSIRWVKRHRVRKVRHRINQLVRIYTKVNAGDYLHLPQVKDLFDIWAWD